MTQPDISGTRRNRHGNSRRYRSRPIFSRAMIIRRFSTDEWRTYRDLRLRALAESPDAFGSTFAREVALVDDDWRFRVASGATAPNELPLLALVDDTPAGLAWGRIADEEPDIAHIYSVWVAPDHRGLGIARLLMEEVIAWARAFGARVVRLDVTVGNRAAVQLYRGLGFIDVGDTQPMRVGSALRSQVMERMLDVGRGRL